MLFHVLDTTSEELPKSRGSWFIFSSVTEVQYKAFPSAFSAAEMLYKHLMKGTDLIRSYFRDKETEAQRKKAIHPRSPHRAGAKPGLASPSSTSTQ